MFVCKYTLVTLFLERLTLEQVKNIKWTIFTVFSLASIENEQ